MQVKNTLICTVYCVKNLQISLESSLPAILESHNCLGCPLYLSDLSGLVSAYMRNRRCARTYGWESTKYSNAGYSGVIIYYIGYIWRGMLGAVTTGLEQAPSSTRAYMWPRRHMCTHTDTHRRVDTGNDLVPIMKNLGKYMYN